MQVSKIASAETIRFSTDLVGIGGGANLVVPDSTAKELSMDREAMVEGIVNGFPFRAKLVATSNPVVITLTPTLFDAAGGAKAGNVAVELTRIGDEPEVRVPADLRTALGGTAATQTQWEKITPNARRDWVLWLCTAKLADTRARRIEKALDLLTNGKKRVCCFGGLGWLVKDYQLEEGETWIALP